MKPVFFIIFTIVVITSEVYAQDDSISSKKEEISFTTQNLTGVGLWLSAYGGSGASARFGLSPTSRFGVQINAFLYTSSTKTTSSVGVMALIPFLRYEHSRYLMAFGGSHYSDAQAPLRFGASVIGEWTFWNHMTYSLGLDVLTFYEDGEIQIPLLSGGVYLYF
jgi:hypothetical protein